MRFDAKLICISPLTEEAMSAIAGYWDAIGVKTEGLVLEYAAVFRPQLVARTESYPYIGGRRAQNTLPWDWPRGVQTTTLTRGGFGMAIEIPFILDAFRATNAEPDAAKRIEINNGLADDMYYWMPQAGIHTLPQHITVNPRAIKEWKMRDGFEAHYIEGPELIVPADR